MTNQLGLHSLILRVAAGDDLAKEALYDAIEKSLAKYIQNRFGSSFSKEDVREIVNYTYMKILAGAVRYRGKYGNSSAWRWAYNIARNRALNWLKIVQRAVDISDSKDDRNDSDDEILTNLARRCDPDLVERHGPGVEDQAIERVLIADVLHCLHLLSSREQKIICMHHLKEMTLEQIANRLGVSRPRIHQILHGAYRKCRDRVGWDQLDSL